MSSGTGHHGQQTRTYTTATLASSAVLTDTRYTFDNYGRMKTVESWASAGVTHAAPQITTYVYDLIGRLSQITYANGVTGVYTYDMLDRLDKLTQYLPDSSPGDLSDNVIAAEYDYTVALDGTRTALAEMVLRDAAAGGGYAVSYYTWTYDNLNRLMSEVITSTEPGVSRTEHYAYDLSGNRIYKGAVRYQGYGYNNATMYTYDANDRLEVETYQSSNPSNFEDTWSDKYYTYGSNGQFTYATQVTESRSVMSSKYDETTGYDIWYTKDTSTTTNYAFNLQARLSGQSESTSVYERWEYYHWESGDFHTENKNTSNSSSASFTYDDSGIRVYSSQVTTDTNGVSQATATLYLVDSMNPTGYAQVLEERTATAAGTTIPYVDALMAVSKAYVLGMDVVQQWTSANASAGLPNADNLVILPDGHGSTRLLLASATGIVASGLLVPGQRFFYDAWGNALAPVGAPAPLTTLLYTGEQRDAATGMYYLRARYYNPGLGRFATMDQWIGKYGSFLDYNGYRYSGADPINKRDPSGYWTLTQKLGGIAIISTVAAIISGGISAYYAPPGQKIFAFFDGAARAWISTAITGTMVVFLPGIPFAISNAVGSGMGNLLVDIFESKILGLDSKEWDEILLNAATQAAVAYLIGVTWSKITPTVANYLKSFEAYQSSLRQAIAKGLPPSFLSMELQSSTIALQKAIKESKILQKEVEKSGRILAAKLTAWLLVDTTVSSHISMLTDRLYTWNMTFSKWVDDSFGSRMRKIEEQANG
jgi:RHS repeat-associated protein